MRDGLLEFDVAKRYRGFTLDCAATLDSGITAIFGPSGSGKTTLLNCIAGLATPDEGEVRVLGQTLYSSTLRRNVPPERRRFGYVYQDSTLFPHMSVGENIRYGYDLTPREHRRIEPMQLVELFELTHLLDRGTAGLSGGEAQRVALARALATSPRLLLLDEPLASLDARFRGLILRYLKRVWQELRTPMLYVSHSVSEVMALAESVLVMRDGRRVDQGRPVNALAQSGAVAFEGGSSIENVLDAEVIRRGPELGVATLGLGRVEMAAADVGAEPGETVSLFIRAGDIIIALEKPRRISARNLLTATIREVHRVGPRVLVFVDVGDRLMVEVTHAAAEDLSLRVGQEVFLIVKSNSIMVLDSPVSSSTP